MSSQTVDFQLLQRVYLLGIGGIGMSALARYFRHRGLQVAGYDLTPSQLTHELESEGMAIHYVDSIELIPREYRLPSASTLVIYTPAVPAGNAEVRYLIAQGHTLHKRAEILGLISRNWTTVAVAGTHGKTTVSTMVAHVLSNTVGCDAILGGIAVNTGSNLVLKDRGKGLFVTEADEYDHSFLQLTPAVSVVTAVQADHLDIYGNLRGVEDAFIEFAMLNQHKKLIVNERTARLFSMLGLQLCTYGLGEQASYRAGKIHYEGLNSRFTVYRYDDAGLDVQIGLPGQFNVENTLACIAAVEAVGVPLEQQLPHLASFKGVRRRFEVRYNSRNLTYVDDYAHHPEEIAAVIQAVRVAFPGHRLVVVFQPHLYTRTRDLAVDFARALTGVDELLLLPIYPAREEPIEGVTSGLIAQLLPRSVPCQLLQQSELLPMLESIDFQVLVTMGAGSIGTMAEDIAELVRLKDC